MAKTFNDIIDGLYIQIGLVEKEYENGACTAPHISETLLEIQEKIKNLEEREPNIEGLEELKQKLELLKAVDMTQYVTKAELPDLLPQTGHLLTESEAEELYVKKSEIPTIKGEKGDRGDEGPIGPKGEDGKNGKNGKDAELPDLSEYVKKSELPTETTDLSEYAKKSELPDVSNLLTEYQADAKYVLNSELSAYARKTDIPQPQDLSNYALKSEIVEPDLTHYVKKSELTQPDLEPYETKTHAEETYVKKSEIPTIKGEKGDRGDVGPIGPKGEDGKNGKDAELPDLSIYALKSDLENLPQGGTTLTAKEISKQLTLENVTSYEKLMDYSLVFVNDSDKPVTITVKEYDKNSGTSPYPLVDKDYTFQPKEEWQRKYDGFNPDKKDGTYQELVVKVDGVKQPIPSGGSAGTAGTWMLKSYINPSNLKSYINAAKDYSTKSYSLLSESNIDSKMEQNAPLNHIESRPKGSRFYPSSDAVKGSYASKRYINGSTIKIIYENATGLNGSVDWRLNTEHQVATNEKGTVFYKGLLKGIYDAETGANVTQGFENKTVIVVYEITDPRWGIK